MTDSEGTPLSVLTSAANEHDIHFIVPLIYLHFPLIGGLPGRPPEKPRRVHADQGYTSSDLKDLLYMSGIDPQIPQRGQDNQETIGGKRWPVERTIAWLKQFRIVGVRRDRRADIYDAMVTLACSLIAFRKLKNLAL